MQDCVRQSHSKAEVLDISNLIKNRKSAVRFADRRLKPKEIETLIEAACHAPSSRNEQPWRFVIARSGTADFDAFIGIMAPSNQAWAQTADVLVLACYVDVFSSDGLANRTAIYDLGAAVAFLALQAEFMDLSAHQIGGFDIKKAKPLLPENPHLQPCVIVAIGEAETIDRLNEAEIQKASRNRIRNSVSDVCLSLRAFN